MEPWIYKQIKEAIDQAHPGMSLCILGPSGVGKTHALKTITKTVDWEVYWIDSIICGGTRDLRDILEKQLGTSLLQKVSGARKRVIVIDELDTLYQLDRNIFTLLSSVHKHHPNHIVVYVGNSLMDKKIKTSLPGIQTLFFSAFSESDICIILKERFPTCSYKDILFVAENCFGNIAQAIHMIEMNQNNIATDEQVGFDSIFTTTSRDVITRILQEDPWVNPLRYHENVPKLLPARIKSREVYGKLLEVLCNWDMLMQHTDPDSAIDYVTTFILQQQYPRIPAGDLGNFTKMFSNLSLQKKNEKTLYPRGDQDFPWIQAQIFCDYSKYS